MILKQCPLQLPIHTSTRMVQFIPTKTTRLLLQIQTTLFLNRKKKMLWLVNLNHTTMTTLTETTPILMLRDKKRMPTTMTIPIRIRSELWQEWHMTMITNILTHIMTMPALTLTAQMVSLNTIMGNSTTATIMAKGNTIMTMTMTTAIPMVVSAG